MSGKLVGLFLVLTSLIVGASIYWLQVYAFYDPVTFKPGEEILLTPINGQKPEPIAVRDVTGIDATSSPLRFRACFTTPLTQAMLTETYVAYEGATPLVAPRWFDCFDATAIGEALEAGEAVAFLSQTAIQPDVDRVVAVFPDGRAFAWHQLQAPKD